MEDLAQRTFEAGIQGNKIRIHEKLGEWNTFSSMQEKGNDFREQYVQFSDRKEKQKNSNVVQG